MGLNAGVHPLQAPLGASLAQLSPKPALALWDPSVVIPGPAQRSGIPLFSLWDSLLRPSLLLLQEALPSL